MLLSPASGDAKVLLIYAPVPLYAHPGGGWLLEDQACNGLRLWARHFDRVICMMPVAPGGSAPSNWVPIDRVGPALEKIEIVPLPMAYRPDQFLRHLPAVRRRIRALIARADYLGFSIGGLFGDWGSVAAWQAHRMGRPFYVWTDRVESQVRRREAAEAPSARVRWRARLTWRPMAALERVLIARATVGLFHGRETFDAYAPYCRNPQIVHDIHVHRQDHIAAPALADKIATAGRGPLRICYAGRVELTKGPMDWVDVVAELAARGCDVQATWMGDGPDLPAMRQRAIRAGVADRIEFAGFVADRDAVLRRVRDAHLFMFCHKTAESPRCLIEALISGTPILGYEGAFARDLISAHGGGRLVAPDDVAALSAAIAELDRDRATLADLIGRAARDGAPFCDEAVFRHRSAVIRSELDKARAVNSAQRAAI